jgi:hypothetical protein
VLRDLAGDEETVRIFSAWRVGWLPGAARDTLLAAMFAYYGSEAARRSPQAGDSS